MRHITASQVRARAENLRDTFTTIGCNSAYVTPDDQTMLTAFAELLEAQDQAQPVASVGRYPGGGPRLDLLVPPDSAPDEGTLLYTRVSVPPNDQIQRRR